MSSSNETSPPKVSDHSPPPEDISVSSTQGADSPEPSKSLSSSKTSSKSPKSNATTTLADDEGSPSSSPPPPPNSESPPPNTPDNLAASKGKSSPPPEASPPPSPHPSPPPPPPRPPPPSPPPPQQSSDGGGGGGGGDAEPPPSPTPTVDESPAPPGNPPSPKPQNSAPKNDDAGTPPSPTGDGDPGSQPFDEPSQAPPPTGDGDPVAIPSPGANPGTAKKIPSPPQEITTPASPGSSFLPPPTDTDTETDTATTTTTPTPTPTSTSTSTSTRTPNHSPSSSDSKPLQSSTQHSHTPSSGSAGHAEVAVGAAVAGLFIIVLIAVIFVFSRKKKRRGDLYPGPYMPPKNFCVKSDGNYHPHQHMGNSGSAEGFYTQVPHTPVGNSFGSQKGTGYSGSGADSGVISSAKFFFSYEELMEITSGFSRQNILGEGGFGCVFKGWLLDGKPVAVKQLKAGSGQGEREFKAEVEIISRVHHRHLVSLVGYCVSENHRLLIYEFVPNMTLEHHLHSSKGVAVLDWSKRLKIALGAAKGLAYLHEDCHPKIIHRDIKSANILLDDAFEAQVADFGLAKLTNDTHTHVSTRVMGTFGYMAPEYASSGKLTDRSDVFSFGVVLLELITGRKPVDPTQPLGDESLVEWARPHLIHALESGEFGELIDPRLEKHYVESEMFRMIEAAAACVRHSAPKRPRMVQVVRALDAESDMSDLSNGVKLGQSTIYDSGQYSQDISKFRRMALGEDSSEYDIYSSEYNSREMTASQESWRYLDNSSGEQETRAFKVRSGVQQSHYGGRQL